MKRILFLCCILTTSLVLSACETATQVAPEPTIAPIENALPTTEVVATATTAMQEITVYFMDENRFIAATEPYEVAVKRIVPADAFLPRAVLDQYFLGPTAEEQAQGLRPHTSGFTSVRQLTIENDIARVYLGGTCANNGAAYSVAALIMKNLEQFPEITAVKIFDENDSNLDPLSSSSSLPYCLEP